MRKTSVVLILTNLLATGAIAGPLGVGAGGSLAGSAGVPTQLRMQPAAAAQNDVRANAGPVSGTAAVNATGSGAAVSSGANLDTKAVGDEVKEDAAAIRAKARAAKNAAGAAAVNVENQLPSAAVSTGVSANGAGTAKAGAAATVRQSAPERAQQQ